MLHKVLNLLPIVVLVAAGGCFDSEHPLSAPEDAIVHTDLLGTWIWKNSGVANDEWTISKAGDDFPSGMLRIEAIDQGKSQTLFGFSTRIGDDYYLNMLNFKDDALPKQWDPKLLKNYTLMQYSVLHDKFTAISLNSKFLTSSIRTGQIAGQIANETRTRSSLTASTERLHDFFKKYRKQILDGDTYTGTRKNPSSARD